MTPGLADDPAGPERAGEAAEPAGTGMPGGESATPEPSEVDAAEATGTGGADESPPEDPLAELGALLDARWRAVLRRLDDFRVERGLTDHSFLFTELGYVRRANSTIEPWASHGFSVLPSPAGERLVIWQDQPRDLVERAGLVEQDQRREPEDETAGHDQSHRMWTFSANLAPISASSGVPSGGIAARLC